eukprot:COSAG01_NODE_8523_length_2753_cov_37.942847_2_plen_108_part_00
MSHMAHDARPGGGHSAHALAAGAGRAPIPGNAAVLALLRRAVVVSEAVPVLLGPFGLRFSLCEPCSCEEVEDGSAPMIQIYHVIMIRTEDASNRTVGESQPLLRFIS